MVDIHKANCAYSKGSAIKAEICIANPEATQSEGFIRWLQHDVQFPDYLIENIVASWDERTYRFTIESEMAEQHFEMTEAADQILYLLPNDTLGISADSLLLVWQRMRTPNARYAEAIHLMQTAQYDSALAVIQRLPEEHVLKPEELDERGRMLAWITDMRSLYGQQRSVTEMDSTEIAVWEGMIAGHYDRPSNYISNLLCFYHYRCRAPLTGGGSDEGKSMPFPRGMKKRSQEQHFTLHPNPASVWVTLTYELESAEDAWFHVRDQLGRRIRSQQITSAKGQVVLDLRGFQAGVYTVELVCGERFMGTNKLVVP